MNNISTNKDFFEKHRISTFTHKAMNTIVNIYIAYEEKDYMQQAAFEAFKEIDLLEEKLSRYIPNSDISKINKLKSGEYTVVEEDTQNCLIRAIEMFDITEGYFDISLGDSIDFWKDKKIRGSTQLSSGMESLIIDKTNFTVIVNNPVNIDLGGIGKGYTLEKIEELFKDWEIYDYLINFGNSSWKANSSNKKKVIWPLTLSNPDDEKIIENIDLSKGCLSSSGIRKGEHIIDSTNLKPVNNNRISTWVYSNDGVESDALSTAFMIMDEKKISRICVDHNLSCAILLNEEGSVYLTKYGDFFS